MDSLAMHAAVALSSDRHLAGSLQVSVTNLDDLIPSVAQDIYHFIDLVQAVRHPVFQLPRAMTNGRFQYLLKELIRTTTVSAFSGLDCKLDIPVSERIGMIRSIPEEYTPTINNLLICVMRQSAQEIEQIAITGSTHATFFDHLLTTVIDHKTQFGIVYRVWTIETFEKQSDKELALRVIASENSALSARAMTLITDMCFPLSLIPGVVGYAHLYQLASEVDPTLHLF